MRLPAESMYEDVYVRSPYINMRAAEKDPAWKAAVREDRVPEQLPRWQPPAETPAPAESGVAPDPAAAAEQATAKVGG